MTRLSNAWMAHAVRRGPTMASAASRIPPWPQKQSRHGRATAGSRKRMEGPRMDNDSRLVLASVFAASFMYVHGQ